MLPPRPALLLTLAILGAAPAARAADLPPSSREQIEQVIHDYLMREPEVLYQAAQVHEQRRRQQAVAEAGKVIAERRAAIFDPTAPSAGPADAKITLVEFFDFRCGYCRQMLPTLRQVMTENPDVRVVFRDLPILGPESRVAASAALAARLQRPDGYFDLHQALLQSSDLAEPKVVAIAEGLGLDGERLRRDMASPKVKAEIDANLALARDLRIEGTPAFVLGDALIPGAVQKADLVRRIDEARQACAGTC